MPSQTATITDIPPQKVETLAKEHKEMGADKIEVIKQSDGLFSLRLNLLVRVHQELEQNCFKRNHSLTVTLRCEPRLRRASKGDGPTSYRSLQGRLGLRLTALGAEHVAVAISG